MKIVSESNLFGKREFLLLAVILMIAFLGFGIRYIFSLKDGGRLEVSVDGSVVKTFLLNKDTEYEIKTKYGTNRLIITNGKASMEMADCPDGICVQSPEISKNGEMIVCLPHKLVLRVVSGEKSEVDAITN